MKITLDIPDTTICAFFDFVYYTKNGMAMQCHSIDSSELCDGSEINITASLPKKKEEQS